ncbi:hypothetical protein E3N88_19084 [Mikania micrantha]|uniref:AMP-dependent synthetase/ligase domain-containing protein n=1 Tax=Mikania micrantha TaxID=192012 RepID=A0A5N6NPW7_9ASTR|nr:hypothetical protein E3N88_19084 [Mikania micrantha]
MWVGRLSRPLTSRHGQLGAVRDPRYKWTTYGEAAATRTAIGSGLVAHGIPKAILGSCIGVYFINIPDWMIVDHACSAYSYVSVPLYDTLGPDAVKCIVNHSSIQAKFCVPQTLQSERLFLWLHMVNIMLVPLSKCYGYVAYILVSKLVLTSVEVSELQRIVLVLSSVRLRPSNDYWSWTIEESGCFSVHNDMIFNRKDANLTRIVEEVKVLSFIWISSISRLGSIQWEEWRLFELNRLKCFH